ncbi:hypothetical protein OHB49_00600 [Streptomyces sp. NBC_01717]|uniref:hypothetical protein n=1 Tax=Streptomyces sp. NBC_01717 TaxID=2975918 RepID=UPI002E32267F|nr:hypothetical protein [Streptomyces sp. NBC_01717]
MASVLGMLKERETVARVRVEGLREEVARLAEVLEAAEIELDRRSGPKKRRVAALAVRPVSPSARWRSRRTALPLKQCSRV